MAHFKVPEITFLGRKPQNPQFCAPHHPGHIVSIFIPLGLQNTKKFLAMG